MKTADTKSSGVNQINTISQGNGRICGIESWEPAHLSQVQSLRWSSLIFL